MPLLLLQYAERLPIGTEKVIRTVSAATVKEFYKKWYHLRHMALIAVGDFPSSEVCNYASDVSKYCRIFCAS